MSWLALFAAWAGIIAWCVYATKDKGETGATTAGAPLTYRGRGTWNEHVH